MNSIAGCEAIIPHGLVHEHAVVVRVEPEQGEGQQLAHFAQHLGQQPLLAHQQRRALGPARGDVGQHQRLHEAALRRPARYARPDPPRRIRAADCPSRQTCAPARCAGPPPRAPPGGASICPLARLTCSQGPVDRRRAHRQQTCAHLRRELQMAMPLHRLDQDRHQRPQPLAADPVRCLPDHDQRLAHRIVVNPAPGPRAATPVRLARPQQPHRMLAVEARHRRELVQDPAPLRPIAPRIPLRYRRHQLVTRRHAHPPHPCPRR